jgi:hypothetical protein
MIFLPLIYRISSRRFAAIVSYIITSHTCLSRLWGKKETQSGITDRHLSFRQGQKEGIEIRSARRPLSPNHTIPAPFLLPYR